MSKLFRTYLAGQCYFITKNCKNKTKVFFNNQYKHLIINDLIFYRIKYKFLINGYVIMPDHFHLLLTIKKEKDLSSIMRDFASITNKQVQNLAAAQGPRLRDVLSTSIWQKRYYDHIIRNEHDFEQKVNYIHYNPVRANLCKRPEYWPHSSYRNYYLNDNSLITIDKSN